MLTDQRLMHWSYVNIQKLEVPEVTTYPSGIKTNSVGLTLNVYQLCELCWPNDIFMSLVFLCESEQLSFLENDSGLTSAYSFLCATLSRGMACGWGTGKPPGSPGPSSASRSNLWGPGPRAHNHNVFFLSLPLIMFCSFSSISMTTIRGK